MEYRPMSEEVGNSETGSQKGMHSSHRNHGKISEEMVGAEGFEPPALCSQSRCATRLRYAPTKVSIYLPQGSDGFKCCKKIIRNIY